MTNNCSEPAGFRGPVAGCAALLPPGGRQLRLRGGGRGLPAAGEGPFAAIAVEALTESMGPVEDVLARLAARLREGGTLVLGFDNRQSPRQLHLVLEGRPGPYDPADSIADPSQVLPLRRVLAAAEAAGLAVRDVVHVPAPGGGLSAGLLAELLGAGFLPLDWIGGQPPARFWLLAERRADCAGSVLIGPGDADAQRRTAASVRAFLPEGWEVVTSGVRGEREGWSRAIAAARGELVWLLRAGADAGEALFRGLAVRALGGPAAPGNGSRRCCPGDLSGLMVARRDLLWTGPLPAAAGPGAIANTRVALEEYCMRLESRLGDTAIVEGPFASPPAAVEAPGAFAAEAEELMRRWSALHGERPAAAGGPHGAAVIRPLPAAPAAAPPWAGREPRISLCMIARDEQRFLAECLRRAQPAVDEIVLVDTGSTDDTVAIATSFGARVLHRPWDDDFSAPRNAGLQAATGDWILVLDADELLTPGAAARIRQLARDARVSGYHMRFTNVYSGGKTIGVMMVRLFRNLPGVEYCNVIHEQVTPSLCRVGARHGLALSMCDVEVEHFGYTDEVMADRGKNERNERLFAKQLASSPDDVYGLYKYGDFLRRLPGRGDDALRLLERCFDLIVAGPPDWPRGLPYAGEVAALCALELSRRGADARAREVVDTALRRFLATPNLHYIAASLHLAERRPDAAIAHFARCLRYRGKVLVVPIQEGITGHVALTGIAQAWLQKGELARARRLLEQALSMAEDYEVAHLALSRLWLQQGCAQEALGTLTGLLARRPDAAGACQQATLILQQLGCTDQARRMGEHALGILRSNGDEHEAARMEEYLAAL